MRLLVGLGNPGEQYDKTRHNAGFHCIDAVAEELGVGNSRTFKEGELYEVQVAGQKALLFTPLQFMNRSGQPVKAVADYFDIAVEDICVAYDDVYVAPGSVRFRKGGGDGGHNGIRSLLAQFSSDVFWRVRIGVGVYEQHPQKRVMQPPLDEYVLQPLPAHEKKLVEKAIDTTVPNLIKWLTTGELAEETVHI